MEDQQRPTLLKRFMAKRCDLCPPCRHARAHPEGTIGKLFAWHGSWCPFWKAWQEIYGKAKGQGAAGSGAGV
ncbi:MAG: hypothetical protein HY744_19615 [Deltaproteobacteria bacterium]|nr:hypothetical protein [Deltaproteobacteria bacterium]